MDRNVLFQPLDLIWRSRPAHLKGLADGLELEAAHVLAHLTREGDTAFAAFERRKESA